ncbi:MAG TPA: DUF1667 domain-containing protein [Candidatus Atribacteria bacterium]|nr:DUF1667 domain-containing protein [Candidatus Atribacteria bacterium]HQE25249.1 DUF1667 domain-containing protein [Candidatus Atribacteria bacterium]
MKLKEQKSREFLELICIVCPLGCSLSVTKSDDRIRVRGGCKKGEKYVKEEITNPRRVVTTTLRIKNGVWPRVPVRTSSPFPRDKIPELMKFLSSLEVEAPQKRGEVIAKNLLGEGVDLVVTRTIERKE